MPFIIERSEEIIDKVEVQQTPEMVVNPSHWTVLAQKARNFSYFLPSIVTGATTGLFVLEAFSQNDNNKMIGAAIGAAVTALFYSKAHEVSNQTNSETTTKEEDYDGF